MKKALLLGFFFVAFLGYSQNDNSLTWLTNLEEAKALSKENKLPILVYFTGSDWCAPCKALKADFFDTQEFIERAKHMNLVLIDYPRRVDIISEEQRAYNKTIISKYNEDNSFPKLVMLNHRGKQLGALSGYSSYNKDTSHHFGFIDDHLGK